MGHSLSGTDSHESILYIYYYTVFCSAKKDNVDGKEHGMELTYSQASGIKMEDLINEYLTSDSNVLLVYFMYFLSQFSCFFYFEIF